MNEKNLLKRITAGIVVFAVLCICLGITTFALIYAMVTVEDNVFTTGFVDINLNDGKPVIYDPEFMFEPGMTVKKSFFVENTGTTPVYYKLYFNNVDGDLVEFMQITITDAGVVLYEGTAAELSRYIVEPVKNKLEAGKKRELEITFYLPEDAGNEAQECTLSFDLCADAVQSENNNSEDPEFPDEILPYN